jgi:hypothetical protein
MADLDFLQEVYEAAVEGFANVGDMTIHEIVCDAPSGDQSFR